MTIFEYAPAPESRAIVELRDSYGLFIGGEFVDPLSDAALTTLNPATEQPLAQVAVAGEQDVDRAVRAARAAFPEWAGLSRAERAKHLGALRDALAARSADMAATITREMGAPAVSRAVPTGRPAQASLSAQPAW